MKDFSLVGNKIACSGGSCFGLVQFTGQMHRLRWMEEKSAPAFSGETASSTKHRHCCGRQGGVSFNR